MAIAGYKVCKYFHMLLSFVKAIDQQAPAVQQSEETICQFFKHSTPKTVGTQNCCSKCPPSASMQACSRQHH